MASKDTPIEGGVIRRRKSKYEPWMCEVIVQLGAAGKDVEHMCIAIGLKSRSTFYEWLDRYEDFKEAYEEAKLMGLAKFKDTLDEGMVGNLKGFNIKAAEMRAYNKFPDDFKRPNSGNHTEINVDARKYSIEKMDDSEVTRLIQEKIKKLELLENVKTDTAAGIKEGDSSST